MATKKLTSKLLLIPQAQTASAGVLSVASGLVFCGENSGSFMAVDAANGKILWQFPTNQAHDVYVR